LEAVQRAPTVKQVIEQATRSADAGQVREAARLFSLVLKQFPNSKPALDGLRALAWRVPVRRLQEVDEHLRRIEGLLGAQRILESIELTKTLLERFPFIPEAWIKLARAHTSLGDRASTIEALKEAGSINRIDEDLHKTLGDLFLQEDQFELAIKHYKAAIEINDSYEMAYNNLGVAYLKCSRLALAKATFEKLLEVNPNNGVALNNLSVIYHDTGRFRKCIEYAEMAIRVQPRYVAAWNNLGNAQMALGNFGLSIESYGQALKDAPDNFEIRSKRMLCMARICDWAGLETEKRFALERLESGVPVEIAPNPWAWLGILDRPDIHKRLVQISGKALKHRPDLGPIASRLRGKKIRLGYFSADFHNHPTTHLIAGLFEEHDRNEFEVHAFSFGPDRDPEFRERIVNGVDHFHEAQNLSDREIAELARKEEIDIAIDLNGHTANKRTGIFTYRAAPVQVTYLGYPGTMGVEDIDYIISDRIVIPPRSVEAYCEKVAYVPNCYQVNDSRRRTTSQCPSRAECALPEGALVFCCFNSSYKITAEVFAIWMRLLLQVEGSILWLFQSNDEVCNRLRSAAEHQGVAPERLVFAKRTSPESHLARHAHADIFLDTLPYNAHTTASDALWMGVPVVTRIGESFAARVGASLLTELGVPELITEGAADYEAVSLKLARDSNYRADLRERILSARASSTLFDTEKFARGIEGLFRDMILECELFE